MKAGTSEIGGARPTSAMRRINEIINETDNGVYNRDIGGGNDNKKDHINKNESENESENVNENGIGIDANAGLEGHKESIRVTAVDANGNVFWDLLPTSTVDPKEEKTDSILAGESMELVPVTAAAMDNRASDGNGMHQVSSPAEDLGAAAPETLQEILYGDR